MSSSPETSLRVLNAQPDDIVMGGVQMRSVSVGERLLDRGIQSDILVAESTENPEGGPVSSAARDKGLRVFQYDGLYRPRAFRDFEAVLHNLQWGATFPVAVARVCSCIRQAAPDVVHVNGLLNIVPAVAAKVMGRPLLWQLIGDHYPRPLVVALRPLVIWLADEIAFEAEQMKHFYFGDKSLDYTLLHEPVDLQRFTEDDQNNDRLRAEFGLDPSQPVIGSVGNISPAKGWEYFLKAIRMLAEDVPNLHALVIGAVSDTQEEYARHIRERIRALGLEDHVTMTGYRTDVEDVLQIVDIFMMASVNEGTPLAILEAMGTGLPVIATDVGGVAEEVDHKETGYICPPRDADALAKACRHLLENPDHRREMGRAGRRRVEEYFSLASSVDDHFRTYQNMAADIGLQS